MTATPDDSEKAYNKGCMWGMSGGDKSCCPYNQDSDNANHWHSGWLAGFQAWSKKHPAQATG